MSDEPTTQTDEEDVEAHGINLGNANEAQVEDKDEEEVEPHGINLGNVNEAQVEDEDEENASR